MKPYPPRIARHMVNLYHSLSEKDRRRYAAVEASKLGYGGTAYIADQASTGWAGYNRPFGDSRSHGSP